MPDEMMRIEHVVVVLVAANANAAGEGERFSATKVVEPRA
jgi:hypothetical protein